MPEYFSHRLDLAARLRDASSGNEIGEQGVIFFQNGKRLNARLSEHGCWLFLDIGRKDFQLFIEAEGFETAQIPVCYGTLDKNLPVVEIPLVPKQNPWHVPALITIAGKLKGIEELQAVAIRETDLYVVSYKEESCLLTLYNPHRKKLSESDYALADSSWREFEIIKVVKRLSDGRIQAARPLKMEWKGNYHLVRPVCGRVSEDGSYLLRVPDYGPDSAWLVRCAVGGKEYFQTIDKGHSTLCVSVEGRAEQKG